MRHTASSPAAAYFSTNTVQLQPSAELSWSSSGVYGTKDVALTRDAANTLAQRNGTNAQTFRLYNTFTDSSNYERGKLEWASNALRIGTEKAGTGAARALEFQTDGVTRLTIGTTGAATFSSTISVEGFRLRLGSRGDIFANSNGVLVLRDDGGTGFNRIQFGGTDTNYPALKRSSTSLQARLADDSAFTNIQGKLTTEANAVAETPTAATHTLTLYDAAGTAYKVLAVAA